MSDFFAKMIVGDFERRPRNLDYPFFANKGEKGTPCSNIFKVHKQQTWFIDDSPYQILAVKKKTPKIKTILFIDNSKLAKLLQNKTIVIFILPIGIKT